MEELERKVRRLQRWNAVWIIVVVAVAAATGFADLRRWSDDAVNTPYAYWGEGSVHIGLSSDGPIVVTHLLAESRQGKEISALSPPLGIADSDGGDVDAEAIRAMVWRDPHVQAMDPPGKDARLTVIYLRPLTVEAKASESD